MKHLTFLSLLLVSGVANASCQLDQSNYKGPEIMIPGLRQYHVRGKHQCQSQENIGYWVEVELRGATDCDQGHMRLRFQNPCRSKDGKIQTNAVSISYQPISCSPLI